MADLYQAVAEEHGLKCVRHLPDHLPFFGDRAMFQQAVANLLDNAIKFSPPNGTVTLSAEILTTGRHSDGSSDQQLSLSVTDEGIGMNDADMARASERFFRAEQARHTPGSGLGLSLVEAIVHLHDGQLQLASNSPGLLARITVPLPDEAATSSERAGDPPPPSEARTFRGQIPDNMRRNNEYLCPHFGLKKDTPPLKLSGHETTPASHPCADFRESCGDTPRHTTVSTGRYAPCPAC